MEIETSLPHEIASAKELRESRSSQSPSSTCWPSDVNSFTDLLNNDLSPALGQKLILINDALAEIGLTPFHWKLFCVAGYGFFANNMLLLVQSIISGQAAYEFSPHYPKALTIASYSGMVAGGLVWGCSADLIGRRWAFNTSLIVVSVFAICAGGATSWNLLAIFVALSGFGAGGNLTLDTMFLLEFLPSDKQWLIIIMAIWWGAGQLVAGLIAWAFIPNFSCAEATNCTRDMNMGWRYVWFATGGLTFVLSMFRIAAVRLMETSKFLVAQGRDIEAVQLLQKIAQRHGRPCSLTYEQLHACDFSDFVVYRPWAARGRREVQHRYRANSLQHIWWHFAGLISTPHLAMSSTLLFISWLALGLGFPLFFLFLPEYLASRGAQFGSTSPYITWRNYAITNICTTLGPIPATWLSMTRPFGRKYTMALSAVATMAFFIAYSRVQSQAQNLIYSCMISFWLQMYLSVLYAYTPEVLPTAHRGTGLGILTCFNSMLGIVSAIVADKADTTTATPIYVCVALFALMAACAVMFPFEPLGRRSS